MAQQNLIADSSFEKNKFIPIDYSAISASTSWSSPSRGTTDLFCKCNDKKLKKLSMVNVPQNSMGNQEARTGNCYAGIFACSHGFYREYLQTTLAQPLERNKEYIFSMYISLSDYSRLAIDKIGVCFLNKAVKYEHSNVITDLRPLYINLEEEVGMDINEWHQLTLLYKAKGGENNLLIGSFGIKRLWHTGNTVPKEISSPINKNIERDAYYYIDDVSIFEYKPEIIDTAEVFNPYFAQQEQEVPETEIVEPDEIQKLPSDVVMAFKNVLFQSGEAILSPQSFPELNIIAAYMRVDPKMYIEIYGHTDNAGDEAKNLELSIKRAAAVGNYLIAKGVISSNVNSDGYGSKRPVESNETAEGRKQNRRVEFILKKR
ncbi:MAG: OmpA family protein [Bacteroidota bacterium]|nr:OmpA family protein [Bacteroidota bacterium]